MEEKTVTIELTETEAFLVFIALNRLNVTPEVTLKLEMGENVNGVSRMRQAIMDRICPRPDEASATRQ